MEENDVEWALERVLRKIRSNATSSFIMWNLSVDDSEINIPPITAAVRVSAPNQY